MTQLSTCSQGFLTLRDCKILGALPHSFTGNTESLQHNMSNLVDYLVCTIKIFSLSSILFTYILFIFQEKKKTTLKFNYWSQLNLIKNINYFIKLLYSIIMHAKYSINGFELPSIMVIYGANFCSRVDTNVGNFYLLCQVCFLGRKTHHGGLGNCMGLKGQWLR